MTDATVVSLVSAVLAAIPPTLVAYAALQQGRVNSLKADSIGRKADHAAERATIAAAASDETQRSTKQIELQTNGQLSRLVADLAHMTAAHQEATRTVAQLTARLTPPPRAARVTDPVGPAKAPVKVEVVNQPLAVQVDAHPDEDPAR